MGDFADTRNHDWRIDTGRVRARVIHLNGSRMYVVLLCTRSAFCGVVHDGRCYVERIRGFHNQIVPLPIAVLLIAAYMYCYL